MTERADRLESPTIDLEAITRNGNQRVRRNRLAAGAAGVAAAVGLGLGLPQVLGGDSDQRGSEMTGGGVDAVVWAKGDRIHVGNDTVEASHDVGALVQTEAGFVFADPEGTIWSLIAGAPERVGTSDAEDPRLVADGTLVGWTELKEGGAPVFAVLDQATGKVVRNSEGTTANAAEGSSARLYAIDDGMAYWRDSRGLVGFDVATERSTVLRPADPGFVVADVEDGVFAQRTEAAQPEGKGDPYVIVSRDPSATGPRLPLVGPVDLSPDAGYAMAENGDDFQVYDVRTLDEVTPTAAKASYAFMTGYSWVDDDTYLVMALTGEDESGVTVDILSCEARTRQCDVVKALKSEFQLPTGMTNSW